MKINHWSVDKALAWVQKCRKIANPNFGFIKMLKEAEKQM